MQESGLCLFESLLNHSCIPNASYERHGNKIYVFALRPVTKGDELFIHNGKKKSDTDIQCTCSKCVPKWKQIDLDRMKSDQDYQDLMQYRMNDVKDPVKHPIIKAKLENLMKNYGRMPWTPEFDGISCLYDHCLRAEYSIRCEAFSAQSKASNFFFK